MSAMKNRNLAAAARRAGLASVSLLAVVVATGAASMAYAQDTAADEVVVTGSRINRTGFTTPTPVTVLGAAQIEQLNITNAGAGITQMPAFRPSLNPTTNGFGSFNVGAQIANLRGLGQARNLVLVDGRRFAPGTREGSVDLNLIPSLLIDRTEVVTGGASAAYGSDAIAGVVNVILAKRLTGIKGVVDYGVTGKGDGQNYHGGLAGGMDLFGGKGHIIAGGEYDKQRGIGSCLTARPDWCRPGIVVSNTGALSDPTLPRNVRYNYSGGYPYNQAGVISILNNTTAATAAVRGLSPTGAITFSDTGAVLPFNVGKPASGNASAGGDGPSPYNFTELLVPTDRYALYSHMDYDFNPNLKGFIEGSYGHTHGDTRQSVYFGTPIQIFADNPYIPTAVRTALGTNLGGAAPSATPATARPNNATGNCGTGVAFCLARLGNRQGVSNSTATTWRVTAGLSGDFNDKWKWDGYYQYGRTHRVQGINDQIVTGGSRVIAQSANGISDPGAYAFYQWATDAVYDPADAALPAANRRIVCRATISADAALRAAAAGCVPLNPFGQNAPSKASLDYIYRTLIEDTTIQQHVVAGNVQGELWNLTGAGTLDVAAGVEYRQDKIVNNHDALSQVFAYFQNFGADYHAKMNVAEAYVEADLPLLKDYGWAKNLSLNAAARQTKYKLDGFGGYNQSTGKNTIDATTWKVGLLYDPVDWLRFRLTRSRDIRAPNFQELFAASASSFTAVTNPYITGNPSQFPVGLNGGNPQLSAEKALTTTYGFVFQPHYGWLDRLRVSVDYYDINIRGYVGTAGGAQNIVNRCFTDGPTSLTCPFFSRDAANNLTEVRNINLNLQNLRNTGVDVEGDYRLPLNVVNDKWVGDFSLRVLASRTIASKTNLFGVITNNAGDTGGGGSPDWLLNVYTTYAVGPASVTLSARYITPGVTSGLRVGPDDPGYSLTNVNGINDNYVKSAYYLNLNGSYNIMNKGGRRLQVFGQIQNLMNAEPPRTGGGQYPTNPTYFDQLGRQFRFGLRFNY